jgi:hypothetical protein
MMQSLAERTLAALKGQSIDTRIVDLLTKPRPELQVGRFRFVFPRSPDDSVRITASIGPMTFVRSTVSVEMTISDGREPMRTSAPLIRMMRAADEAQRLSQAIDLIDRQKTPLDPFSPALTLVDRHIATYVNPLQPELACPITGPWGPDDIVELTSLGASEQATVLEKARVGVINRLSRRLGVPLNPWARYETFMCAIAPDFSCLGGRRPGDMAPEPTAAVNANLLRFEISAQVRRETDGQYLEMNHIEPWGIRALRPENLLAPEPQGRFIEILRAIVKSTSVGMHGASIEAIRLALDLIPDGDVPEAYEILKIALSRRAQIATVPTVRKRRAAGDLA